MVMAQDDVGVGLRHGISVTRRIVRRALKAGIMTRLGCHTFRATGITVYLLNGGLLEYPGALCRCSGLPVTRAKPDRNRHSSRSGAVRQRLFRYGEHRN